MTNIFHPCRGWKSQNPRQIVILLDIIVAMVFHGYRRRSLFLRTVGLLNSACEAETQEHGYEGRASRMFQTRPQSLGVGSNQAAADENCVGLNTNRGQF